MVTTAIPDGSGDRHKGCCLQGRGGEGRQAPGMPDHGEGTEIRWADYQAPTVYRMPLVADLKLRAVNDLCYAECLSDRAVVSKFSEVTETLGLQISLQYLLELFNRSKLDLAYPLAGYLIRLCKYRERCGLFGQSSCRYNMA